MMCDNTNHPLANMADSDKDLLEWYGTTTYKKGSFIAFHLSNLLGADVFHEGDLYYLIKFQNIYIFE